jgi:hypothetical protein
LKKALQETDDAQKHPKTVIFTKNDGFQPEMSM